MKFEEEIVGKFVEFGLWSPDTDETTPDPENLEGALINMLFTEGGELFDPELNERFYEEIVNDEGLLQLALSNLLEKVLTEMEREIELYKASANVEEDKEFKENKKKYLKMIKKTAKEKGENKSVAVQFEGVSHPIYMKAGDFCDLVEFTDKYDPEIKTLFANRPTPSVDNKTNTETEK